MSEFASKEYGLEKSLDKMQNDWMGVNFEYAEWKNTKTNILRGIDDLQMMLDDQLIKTQSMQASPYIGPFQDRVRIWSEKLVMLQKVCQAATMLSMQYLSMKMCKCQFLYNQIDGQFNSTNYALCCYVQVLKEWLQCQMQWLYLEPIFTSEDIMSQMPNEGRRFRNVDAIWRKIMLKLAKNPDALTVGSDSDTYQLLQESNKDLELVQKGLNDYLETKRLAFPR